jgi:tRNA modification GTPase
VLFFPAPTSYTGEDVLELQGHGGPVVLDLLLSRVLALGARIAQPGEFTRRAFLNGKLDLLQAEAVADLIESATAEAARSARRTLDGVFSERVTGVSEALKDLRTQVEAAIDFPDEDVEMLDAPGLEERLSRLAAALDELRRVARHGQVLREGIRVAIAGRPNVGKSSLLNALAGREVAIVTGVPGTTRDLVWAQVQIDGIPVHLVDTAGLRETRDPVERIGVERAWACAREADVVLLVVDASEGYVPADAEIAAGLPAGLPLLVVWNKTDLVAHPSALPASPDGCTLYVSACTGFGLQALQQALRTQAGAVGEEGIFLARRRHLVGLQLAQGSIERAAGHLYPESRPELLAEELRQAQNALAELTGAVTSEDLLERIFSTFCIGK